MKDLANRRKLDEALIAAGARPRFGGIQAPAFSDPLANDDIFGRNSPAWSLSQQPPIPYRNEQMPAPALEDLQPLQDDHFATQQAAQANAERRMRSQQTPYGLGPVVEPFVNAATDPLRRESIVDFGAGAVDWLGNAAEGVGDYFGDGRAARDVQRVPGSVASIPDRIGEAARAAPQVLNTARMVGGALADMAIPDDPMEMATLPMAAAQQTGRVAAEYGPGFARGMTYGPWEDEAEHQRQVDYLRAFGDEDGARAAADAANLDTAFAGMNLGFGAMDAGPVIRTVSPGIRRASEAIGAVADGVGDNLTAAREFAEQTPVLREGLRYGGPWIRGSLEGRAVGVPVGASGGYLLSDEDTQEGRLGDAAFGAALGYGVGGPIGGVARTAPRVWEDINAARNVSRATVYRPSEHVEIVIEPDGRVSALHQGGYQSGGGSGAEAVQTMSGALRALEEDIAATGRDSYHWTPGPEDVPDERLAEFYRNAMRTRTPPGYVFSETEDGVMHLSRAEPAESVPFGQALRRDGEIIDDPIDWEAPNTGFDIDPLLPPGGRLMSGGMDPFDAPLPPRSGAGPDAGAGAQRPRVTVEAGPPNRRSSAPRHVLVQTPDGRSFRFGIQEIDGRASLDNPTLPNDLRGQGIGSEIMRAAVDDAHARGVPFVSGGMVSPDGMRLWQSLERRGYDVQGGPHSAEPIDGYHYAEPYDGRSIFTTSRGPARPDAGSGAAIPDGAPPAVSSADDTSLFAGVDPLRSNSPAAGAIRGAATGGGLTGVETALTAGGGTAAALAAAGVGQDAEASGGDPLDGFDPTIPILGGVSAATIGAILGRRPGLARELNHQVGMFAGVNARTADRAALARAEEMVAQGASRDDVWRETGWFKGVDGQWRFEIDDSGARLSPAMRETRRTGEAIPLADALDHPALNEAYPDTSPIGYDRLPSGARGRASEGQISVSRSHPGGERGALSTTLHEVQHDIQRQEGFAGGGDASPLTSIADSLAGGPEAQAQWEALRSGRLEVQAGLEQARASGNAELVSALKARDRQIGEEMDRFLALHMLSPGESYRRTAGEVEARNVQARQRMSSEERQARPPWETQDVSDAQQIVRQRHTGAAALTAGGLGAGALALGADDAEASAEDIEMPEGFEDLPGPIRNAPPGYEIEPYEEGELDPMIRVPLAAAVGLFGRARAARAGVRGFGRELWTAGPAIGADLALGGDDPFEVLGAGAAPMVAARGAPFIRSGVEQASRIGDDLLRTYETPTTIRGIRGLRQLDDGSYTGRVLWEGEDLDPGAFDPWMRPSGVDDARHTEQAARGAAIQQDLSRQILDAAPPVRGAPPLDDFSFPAGAFDPQTGQPLFGDLPAPPSPRGGRPRRPIDELAPSGQARRIGPAPEQIKVARDLGVGEFETGRAAMEAIRQRAQTDPAFLQRLRDLYPSIAALLLAGAAANGAGDPMNSAPP